MHHAKKGQIRRAEINIKCPFAPIPPETATVSQNTSGHKLARMNKSGTRVDNSGARVNKSVTRVNRSGARVNMNEHK